jgi:hypothetical protein
MFAILHALGMFVVDLFKSRSRLEAENLFLRHQLNIVLRRAPVPTANPKRLTRTTESGDSSLDERSLQVDLVWLD